MIYSHFIITGYETLYAITVMYPPITVAAQCKEHICLNSATNSKFIPNSFNSKAEETGTNSSFYVKSIKAFFLFRSS
jgi:hypothetical protein